MIVARFPILFAALIAAMTLSAGPKARADVTIDITKGHQQPMPIAVTSFNGANPRESQIGHDISQVVSADLERSGLFRPIDPKAFIQTPESLQAAARFADWRVIDAQALVQGKTTLTPDGQIRVEFRLWDVFAESYMMGQAFNAPSAGWRRIGHAIADAVYKRITGEDGYFDTQIVYVAESGPPIERVKRLAIMDQDGENHRFLTDGRELVLTPRFSPNQREITYLSYFHNQARVYLLHLETGRREMVGDFPGMTFAPRFSPDGQKVVMSLAENGHSNIYQMDLRTRHTTRITNDNAIDTSPCYSPDGSQIAFESDRGGSQQLYVMNADGSNQRRISFGEKSYGTPVWSPRGDLIAFTKPSLMGNFSIGVMHPDGSGERKVSEGTLVEGPTWAPNGRVLAFWTQDKTDAAGLHVTTKLHSVDLTGTNERQLVTPLDGSDPAWSPLNP